MQRDLSDNSRTEHQETFHSIQAFTSTLGSLAGFPTDQTNWTDWYVQQQKFFMKYIACMYS